RHIIALRIQRIGLERVAGQVDQHGQRLTGGGDPVEGIPGLRIVADLQAPQDLAQDPALLQRGDLALRPGLPDPSELAQDIGGALPQGDDVVLPTELQCPRGVPGGCRKENALIDELDEGHIRSPTINRYRMSMTISLENIAFYLNCKRIL